MIHVSSIIRKGNDHSKKVHFSLSNTMSWMPHMKTNEFNGHVQSCFRDVSSTSNQPYCPTADETTELFLFEERLFDVSI